MKIVKVLLVSIFVLGVVNSASALNFELNKVKPFGSLDMFSVANADDRMENGLKAQKKGGCVTYSNTGGATGLSAFNTKANAGLGFRVGALYPIEDIGDVGLSWGYVSGPNGKLELTTSNGLQKQDYSRRFYRFLAEGRRTFKYNDKFSFLGGAGLGVAFGKEEYENTTPGAETERTTDGLAFEPTKADKYFSGLAWELTAGVVYKATDKLNVEGGFKLAGFPSCPVDGPTTRPGNEDVDGGEFYGMNWRTLGFFVGVSF